MAAKLYLEYDVTTGLPKRVAATVSSAGAADDGKIPALDAAGKLDSTLMPTGFGTDSLDLTASEAISAGDYVNIWDSGSGVFRIRKADGATPGKEAHGFVLANVSSSAVGKVYFEGTNTAVTSQVPGKVFLSVTVPGKGQATPPTGAGQQSQIVGFATTATSVNFQSLQPTLL